MLPNQFPITYIEVCFHHRVCSDICSSGGLFLGLHLKERPQGFMLASLLAPLRSMIFFAHG
jgi:hypothetical protein